MTVASPEVHVRTRLPLGGRLANYSGYQLEGTTTDIYGPRVQDDPCLTWTFTFVSSASVSGSWRELVDQKSQASDLPEFANPETWKCVPYAYSDFRSECSDEAKGSTDEISAFVDIVYNLARQEKEDYAIDVIFEHMNSLLVEGRFDDCDRILAEVDLARIPPVLMVSFLTITAAAKANLRNRNKFFKVVWRAVARQRGEKAADRLLDGLD